MADLLLTGLDGANPLGFLAALGVLEATASQSSDSRLRWVHEGAWHPVLTCEYPDIDALIDGLDADRRACMDDPALALEYEGKRDLKPPPERFRQYLEQLTAQATAVNRRSVDWAGAFATDVVTDNNGNTKPTALHFTAGQQQFLQMAIELVKGVSPKDLREALVGPWTYERPLPVLGWDATVARDYALRASDPSTDKKHGVPGADWLALRGLACLPAVPSNDRVLTTGCAGGWKDGRFRWPLWAVSLTAPVVRSVLRQNLEKMPPPLRAARGMTICFSSGIRRSEQGGYGSFEPASAI